MLSHSSQRLVYLLRINSFLFLFFLGQLCLPLEARIIKTDDAGKGNVKGHFIFDTVEVNLEELIESSDRVFTGICTNIEVIKNDKKAKLPVVRYTFKVQETIKGIDGNNKISFKQWEPTTRDSGYDIGKKYVLFLHPNSTIGLTSPVGFLQGQFVVSKDLSGNETVKNKVNNSGLTRNIKAKAALSTDKTYSRVYEQIKEKSEKGEEIHYTDFIQVVKYLAEHK